jgi:hypothetical protein
MWIKEDKTKYKKEIEQRWKTSGKKKTEIPEIKSPFSKTKQTNKTSWESFAHSGTGSPQDTKQNGPKENLPTAYYN